MFMQHFPRFEVILYNVSLEEPQGNITWPLCAHLQRNCVNIGHSIWLWHWVTSNMVSEIFVLYPQTKCMVAPWHNHDDVSSCCSTPSPPQYWVSFERSQCLKVRFEIIWRGCFRKTLRVFVEEPAFWGLTYGPFHAFFPLLLTYKVSRILADFPISQWLVFQSNWVSLQFTWFIVVYSHSQRPLQMHYILAWQ